MTARHIAFLRGINVGGRRVKMDRLRAEFAACGFEAVATVIASGNVVFEADGDDAALEAQIEARLSTALGFEVATFVRHAAEVARVAAFVPFPEVGGEGLTNVAFLRRRPSPTARRAIEALSNDTDLLRVRGRELYWWINGRMMDSTVSGPLDKAVPEPMTVRNMTTVRRIAEKYPPR
ncbi:MAG: DUF1697 domain-containing protein [Acidimicrobiia bacterium]